MDAVEQLLCTLADLGCEVLQEDIIQQLSKVIQNKREAWFGVGLARHRLKLLLVGLAARVVLNSQTPHLETRPQILRFKFV